MPMFGLGFRKVDNVEATESLVRSAISEGYRHIDTASVYENEAAVGRALLESSIPRQDVFVTTKVWNSEQGYERTLDAFERSLDRLGLDYIDLYLLQWPMIRLRRESWRALTQLVLTSRCRAIGVCNFTIRHLEEIINETGIVPAVNQVEFNPYLNQAGLLRWCSSHDIQLVTYTPIPRGRWRKDPRLQEIAAHYGKSPAQVLLRWSIQKGAAVLTRATTPEEIREHADVFNFEISLRDMDVLGRFHENLRVGWDPTKAP